MAFYIYKFNIIYFLIKHWLKKSNFRFISRSNHVSLKRLKNKIFIKTIKYFLLDQKKKREKYGYYGLKKDSNPQVLSSK